MSGETIAIAAVGVALLGVLVPLLLTIRGAIAELRADVGELRRELGALAERVARIEARWAAELPRRGHRHRRRLVVAGLTWRNRCRPSSWGACSRYCAASRKRERCRSDRCPTAAREGGGGGFPRLAAGRPGGAEDPRARAGRRERATLLFPTLDALRWWWLGWWCGRHHRRLVGTPAHGSGRGGPETAHGVF